MATTLYRIDGNTKIPSYDSSIEVEVDDRYEAYSKPIPDRTPFEDGFITWFNAFGVREKASLKDASITYTVTLRTPPVGKRLFVLYDGRPHEIKAEDAGKGLVKFSLNVGDPPVGHYP